ncbi:hypothetical protein F7725_027614 [Dissostichus mawsoni]|uniref:Flavin-containing monooxygenase n=1 Tax=Dissostichus mawsoni TaxID=36200 RepID=A0A7J5XDE4_DISMA|nr:hypothetical protein F7725_027614 [Dissostichus mawsoni]
MELKYTRRVAVIGGGSSGLACIKSCLDEGLEPVCYESSDDIGGLWRFKENPEPDRASIYHSVIINTSKEMMCFSDFPIPANFPNYMHNSLIMDYFRMYADHFQLTKHIRFNTKVLQVRQRSDFAHSGQWDVETENKDGKTEKHIFDAVMICIGHHCHPNLPLHDFPGIDTFEGTYFHSRDYKTPEEWRNKKAVVIGIGNSGGDIAVELSRVTKQLYLSTRRGAWILNRVGDNGQHPTVNDELPNRILSGTVQVKPNIRRLQGSSVEFDDGSVVEDVDLVVFPVRDTLSRSTISTTWMIAGLLGVRPNIPRLLLTDPRLGLKVLFGPSTPYQYRLKGPGKWAGARQAIFTQWERVAQPMQTRPCDDPKTKRSFMWPLVLSAAVVGWAAYVNRNNFPAYLQDPTALLDKMKVYLPAQ